MNKSDQEFFSNYLNGDAEPLGILIRRYLKPIYSFVYGYIGNSQDTKDITQEIFVKVWRHIKRFDQSIVFFDLFCGTAIVQSFGKVYTGYPVFKPKKDSTKALKFVMIKWL
ncbi:MAG: sigma factor [Patescibacteria group bacterium]